MVSVAITPVTPFEDALGQSLRRLAIGHAQSAYNELPAPFGVRFPSGGSAAGFHMVFAGRCWLSTESGCQRWLSAGDLALLPHGSGHVIADRPESHVVPYTALKGAVRGGANALLCGTYKFGAVGKDPVLALLPEVVVVPAEQVRESPGFVAVLNALRAEITAARPGHDAVVSSLVDASFIYIVRAWLANQDPVDAHWLAALRDPGLSRCLTSIHTNPKGPWTVAGLASVARMSRAAFARRFTQLVGASPLAYVAARRLDQAARLLRDSDQPLGAIASAVGYESEFALSRAFKRSRELAPGRYRAMHRGAAAHSPSAMMRRGGVSRSSS
ncbi:MAG: AraC family transcriptional regulator [Myxococcales bacterium]|nr:AraC family transcriptional regulator [Myxococcales bacterium]